MTDVNATEGQTLSQQASAGLDTGKRARRAFMMKQFLSGLGSDPVAWIAANVTAKGKGFQTKVGRVYGYATSADEKFNDYQGNQLRSVTLYGVFNTENYQTGELTDATTVYLPLAFSDKIFAAFKADPTIRLIEIDCDIGLEATGKSIPYEWVVISYVEGKEAAALSALRNRRARPQGVSAALPSYDVQKAQAALEGPSGQVDETASLNNGDVIEGEVVSEGDQSAPAVKAGKAK